MTLDAPTTRDLKNEEGEGGITPAHEPGRSRSFYKRVGKKS